MLFAGGAWPPGWGPSGAGLPCSASSRSGSRPGRRLSCPDDRRAEPTPVPPTTSGTPLSRVVASAPGARLRFCAAVLRPRLRAGPPLPRGGPIPGWRTLHLGPAALGYVLGGRDRALVIGGGGGRDISTRCRRAGPGRRHRAEQQHPGGGRRRRCGTRAPVHAARRAHDHRRRRRCSRARPKYDQIHIGFTDTLCANSAQAFALTENNLYTVEAFQEYFDHLKPNGVLDVSRLQHLVGDEALRVTVARPGGARQPRRRDPERTSSSCSAGTSFNELFGTVLGARPHRSPPPSSTASARWRNERGEGVAFAPGGPY